MRLARLVLISFVALVLAPGTCVRTIPSPREHHNDEPVRITAVAGGELAPGPLALEGIWEMSTRDWRFGGYSGLISTGDDGLLAISDNGILLKIQLAGDAPTGARVASINRDLIPRPAEEKSGYDTESLARDPVSGTIYAAYEGRNAIERISPEFVQQARVSPPEMADWGDNSGPEAMTRLPDGRFILIEEAEHCWFDPRHRALLFSGDPTRGAQPESFTFTGIAGYRPVDITPLPDGRVLILMRRLVFWGLPPRFEGVIIVADPRGIVAGGEWGGDAVTWLEPPLPTDNYEGITVTQGRDGATYVWLISDNNFMQIQRTLLLKLRWNPDA